MAEMSTEDRNRVWAWLVRFIAWTGLLKADVLAAANACDTWCDANQTSFNSALPQPFRSTATMQQKAELLAAVVRRRAGRDEG